MFFTGLKFGGWEGQDASLLRSFNQSVTILNLCFGIIFILKHIYYDH